MGCSLAVANKLPRRGAVVKLQSRNRDLLNHIICD